MTRSEGKPYCDCKCTACAAIPPSCRDCTQDGGMLRDYCSDCSYCADAARCQHDGTLCYHTSDCAVHNEPAFPSGPCNCGGGVN